LWWAVNAHCPIQFERAFKHSFGMRVTNEDVVSYKYCRWPNHLCWFYPQNLDGLPLAVFQDRMTTAYRQILDGLCITEWAKPGPRALGIAYRHHLEGIDTFGHFWECLLRVIAEHRPQHVNIATDSLEMRTKISSRLTAIGIVVTTNEYPLMSHDFDRSSANVLGMCAELKSLACCELGVVANSTRSTVADSLRGIGMRPYFTKDDGWHRYKGRDHLFEAGLNVFSARLKRAA
jgi:hypothetical protein